MVSEELKLAGFEGFGFFGFTLVGLAILATAVIYIVLIGRKLLPGEVDNTLVRQRRRSIFELWEDYRNDRREASAKIRPNSPLVGRTIKESKLESHYGISIISIKRRKSGGGERIISPSTDPELQADDTLLLVSLPADYERFVNEQELLAFSATKIERQRWLRELGGATVLVHPESRLIGKSLREGEFRTRFNLLAIGLRRNREAVADFESIKLAASDSLFLVGSWAHIHSLQSLHHDFVVLEVPAEHEEVVPAYRRMPISLIILAAMVLLTVFDVVPLLAAVISAGLAAGATRCLTMEDAYRSIHWSSLVLVAGMLPLADALQKTGGTALIVGTLTSSVGDADPRVMFTLLFFLTAGLGLVLSNTASAVLVAPIAIATADALGVFPYPFALGVLIAASAAYSTNAHHRRSAGQR